LWTLKLHVAVVDATSASMLRDIEILVLGADVLVSCIGPLAAMCLSDSGEETASPLRDALIESISRGIAAYEAAALGGDASASSKAYVKKHSDSAISFLAESLLGVDMIRASDGIRRLEKGAKVRLEQTLIVSFLDSL
jgi:hypothetical protein